MDAKTTEIQHLIDFSIDKSARLEYCTDVDKPLMEKSSTPVMRQREPPSGENAVRMAGVNGLLRALRKRIAVGSDGTRTRYQGVAYRQCTQRMRPKLSGTTGIPSQRTHMCAGAFFIPCPLCHGRHSGQ